MPPRQTVLKPLGLITRPNELGAYPPGAMAVAENILFRDSGQCVVSKALTPAHTGDFGADASVVRKLFVLDDGFIWLAYRLLSGSNVNWSMSFLDVANDITLAATRPTLTSANGFFSDTGFIAPIRMRDHFVVNSQQGVIVADYMAPATGAQGTFRMAGLPQAQINLFTAVATAGGAVANNTTVGYCALFKRVFPKGYEVISTPSLIYRFQNTLGGAVNVSMRVDWSVNAGMAAGDIIEIYRTDAIAAVTATTDPGTTCKLVLTYTLTAADIIATNTTVTDTQVPGPLGVTFGRELYTNPGQGGALSGNRQPNICKVQASYKGFAFFANVTERPIWTVKVPAGMSNGGAPGLSTDYERTFGVGTRVITANASIGASVVSGVSATHLIGIKVGQLLTNGGGAFPNNVFTVASIGPGPTDITFSGAATATVIPATLHIADQIQIAGGASVPIGSLSQLTASLGTGEYELTCDQTIPAATQPASGFTLTVEPARPNFATTITIRGTNGANFSPPIPEIGAAVQTFTQTPRPNFLQWTHEQQPEHGPVSNTAFVGLADLVGASATRDALWIFCTDGLFRLSGDGGQWRIDQLDTTLILSAPQCATVLRDSVYAYTNRGLVHIADDGFDEVSDLTVGDILPGPAYVETASLIVERDETFDEIHLITAGPDFTGSSEEPPPGEPEPPAYYLYNTVHKCWSKLTFANVTALAYQRIPTNPVTQPNGWVVVGTSDGSGVPNGVNVWLFDQAVTAANLTAVIQYQPFYEDDPLVLRHWIDATWLFALVDATRTINSSWLGVADGSATLVAWLNGDARATFGIPRSAAIAPTLSPGLTIPGGGVFTPPTCKGLSVRFSPLTEQQVYR
jgi:hypothetical protein